MSKRTLDFADGFESSEEPNGAALNAGDVSNTPAGNVEATTVQGAINEIQTEVDGVRTDTDTNTTDLDSVESRMATAEADILALEGAQVETLYTEQASTPATPDAGTKKLYAKTDGKLYTLDSAGEETEVGSGAGGGGGFNANPDPYFQDDAWVAEGSETGIEWTVSTTDETLGGAANPGSATIAKDTSDRDGQGRKVTIPITGEIRAMGGLNFNLKYTSSTGIASGDYAADVVDQSGNPILIQGLVSGRELPGVSASGFQKARGWIPLDSSVTSIDFKLVANDGSTTATDIEFIGPFLGEGRLLNGVVDKQVEIDVSGSGDFDSGTIRVTRIGGKVTIDVVSDITFTSSMSAPNSATGLIPDWALPTQNRFNPYVTITGQMQRMGVLTDGQVGFEFRDYSGTLTNRANSTIWPTLTYAVEQTEPRDTLTASELMNVSASARAGLSVSTNTIPSGAYTEIVLDTVEYDDLGLFDIANNKAVIQRAGRYTITANIAFAVNTTGSRIGTITVNGVSKAFSSVPAVPSVYSSISLTDTLDLEVGDEVTMRGWQNTGSTLAIQASNTSLAIVANPDFSVYGNTGPMNRWQTKILSANVTTNGTVSDLGFSGLEVGKMYRISGHLQINAAAGDTLTLIAFVNGSTTVARGSAGNGGTGTTVSYVGLNGVFKASDTTITCSTSSFSAGTELVGSGATSSTYVVLEEINDYNPTEYTGW